MAKDEFSGLRAAYAAATGVSLRTAQRHQKSGHPDWTRFIGAEAAAGVQRRAKGGEESPTEAKALAAVSPFRPVEVPAFYDVPDGDLHPVQLAEKRAWMAHSATFSAWEEMREQDALVAIAYVRELPKLRDDYVKARNDRERWELEQRRLVTMSEFERFVKEFVRPLVDLYAGLLQELPPLVNPERPALARQALLQWEESRARPKVEALLQGSADFAG